MSVAVRFMELTWACAWWNQCIFVPPYISVALRFIESSLHWARNLPAFHHGGQIQPSSAQAWAQAVHWEKTSFQEEPGLASNTLCTWSWRCSYHSRGPWQMEKVCGWHLEKQSILLDIHASSWWSFTFVGRKAMSSLSPGHPEQGSAGEAWRWFAETQMQCQEVPNLHQRTSWASSFCWKPGRSHPFGNPGSSTPAPFESRSPCCCSPALHVNHKVIEDLEKRRCQLHQSWVLQQEKLFRFGADQAWADVEADDATFDKKVINKQMLWEQWCGLV